MLKYQKIALALVITGALVFLAAFISFKRFTAPTGQEGPSAQTDTSGQDQNSTRLKALVVRESDATTTRPEEAELPAQAPPRPKPNTATASGFTEDKISERLQLQSRYFFRCYSHLLENDPSQKGKVVVGFTIGSQGEVSFAQIASSDFDNDVFHRCLVDVVQRTPFPSFEGRPISTLFPIEFE